MSESHEVETQRLCVCTEWELHYFISHLSTLFTTYFLPKWGAVCEVFPFLGRALHTSVGLYVLKCATKSEPTVYAALSEQSQQWKKTTRSSKGSISSPVQIVVPFPSKYSSGKITDLCLGAQYNLPVSEGASGQQNTWGGLRNYFGECWASLLRERWHFIWELTNICGRRAP